MASIGKDGRIKLTSSEKALLLADCNSLCPLCGNALIFEKNGKGAGFQAAHIYPHSPTNEQKIALQGVPMPKDVESLDNIILLCERSHNIQDFHTTKQDYLRLYNIKQRLLRQRLAKESIAEINIEPEIDQILEELTKLTPDDLIELKMIPVEVEQKVSDIPLKTKILGYVSQYFNYIKAKLQNIDKLHNFCSEAIAKEISLCFTKIKRKELIIDQNIVFDAITDWLVSKTHGSRSVCEIIVAYFVQDCEVFDAPSK